MTPAPRDARQAATKQRSLADIALELVDKVGVDGAIRYCHSLGWGGVLAQIEAIRAQRQRDR